MKRHASSIIKRHLKVLRYLRLLYKTTDSLRTWGVRKTSFRIVHKVQRKLGLAPDPSLAMQLMLRASTRQAIRQQKVWSATPGDRPNMHLVLPLSCHSTKSIRETVQSIRAQSYPHWTLDILCHPETGKEVRKVLERLKKSERRIRILSTAPERSPQESLNSTLDTKRMGYFGLIQEGDQLSRDALYHVASALEKAPELDVLYTDEAHIKLNANQPEDVLLKPDWSPEMLLGYNYLGSLCMIRESLLNKLGGFAPLYQEAQEWDLSLRLMEHGCQVKRVPHCCYLRRTNTGPLPHGTASPASAPRYRQALEAYLTRQGRRGDVETCENGVQRIRWKQTRPSRVSIIIPNKNSLELIRSLVNGLLYQTDYSNKEIIIVDNYSTDPAVLEFYREVTKAGNARVVPFNQEFNYSAACNAGYQAAEGSYLLFLNNDMEIVASDWLDELVGWASQPDVGVVGAKLLYPDRSLQHCGVVLGLEYISHIHHGSPDAEWGVFGTPNSYRNYLGVTGACQMISRSVFEEIGGYDENYQLAYSDIALCLHALNLGYRIVYTPHASLVHHESLTRGHHNPFLDAERMAQEIWEMDLQEDPYYHPELSSTFFEPRLRGLQEPTPREKLQQYLEHYHPDASSFVPVNWFDDEDVLRTVSDFDLSFTLPNYDPSQVSESFLEATRLILSVLRTRPDLRLRFPKALSEGKEGGFCQWLCEEGLQQFRLPGNAAKQISEVFLQNPGLRIRQLLTASQPELKRRFPTALLPSGQKSFLRWLLSCGQSEYQIQEEQIWWFFLEASEDPVREFEETYRILDEWQRYFPGGLTPFGREKLLNWLKTRSHIDEILLEEIRQYTEKVTFADFRMVYWFNRQWQALFPRAFRDSRATRDLIQWLDSREETAGYSSNLKWKIDQTDSENELGLNVLGHFCYPSGLQQSVRSIVESLQRAGVALSCRDVPVNVNLDDPDRRNYLGLETYDVSLIHVQPEPFFDTCYERAGLLPRPQVYRIGLWYWELEEVPSVWQECTRNVNELWAPTEFIANAFAESLDTKVTCLLPGIEIGKVESFDRQSLGIQDHQYLFLFMFDMKSIMERKNPLGLIKAYCQAFSTDDRVKLVIKVSGGAAFPEEFARLSDAAKHAGAVLIDETLTREKSYGLIQACDCYVSLHRSEGFGLTMAEAMLMGKPVVATGYSGNLDFMDDSTALLVDYHLTQLQETCPAYVLEVYPGNNYWADPSVEQAASWMRWAYRNQDEARALGLRAQKHAKQVLSPETAGERLKARLEEIYDSLGTNDPAASPIRAA